MSEGINIFPHDKFIFLYALENLYSTGFGENIGSDKWFIIQKKYKNYYKNVKMDERDKIEKECLKKLIDYFFNEIEKLDPDLTIDSYK